MSKIQKYLGPTIITGDQKLTCAVPSHVNYGKFVLSKLLQKKYGVVLINGETGDQMTYGEMAQQIVNTASYFKNLGVGPGDVVGICSENREEFLVTALAGMCTEAVVTFINSAYSKGEIIHTLNISKPKYFFLSQKTAESYYSIIKNLDFIEKFFIFGSAKENITSFAEVVSKSVNIDSFEAVNFKGAEKTALILYSSGTTGLPKGAKLSHRNLITSGLQPFNYEPGLFRTSLSVAPWSNTVGIILTMDQIIYNQKLVYLSRFNEETYLKCIEKYKVNVLLAVPPLIVLLNKSKIIKKYDVSSVELVYSGGASLDFSVIDESKNKFPNLKHILQGYGMTELTGALTEEHDDTTRQGSVGKVAHGIIIKIVDVESRNLLGPNQPGEVCAKGPLLFEGYVGKQLSDDLDNEGFYSTGDIAYYDEDGYFYIVDRLKELIKYKAGQVAPSELEALLRQHPAVKDVGVVGVPDPLAGELPAAFVVKMDGVPVTEKELIDFVGSKVSSWKQLRGGVRFVQEIPKNGSGKILRRTLRELISKSTTSKL